MRFESIDSMQTSCPAPWIFVQAPHAALCGMGDTWLGWLLGGLDGQTVNSLNRGGGTTPRQDLLRQVVEHQPADSLGGQHLDLNVLDTACAGGGIGGECRDRTEDAAGLSTAELMVLLQHPLLLGQVDQHGQPHQFGQHQPTRLEPVLRHRLVRVQTPNLQRQSFADEVTLQRVQLLHHAVVDDMGLGEIDDDMVPQPDTVVHDLAPQGNPVAEDGGILGANHTGAFRLLFDIERAPEQRPE